MTAPVVVFAVGNPSRGDDAIAPALLARLAGWLEDQGLSAHFELIEDFQLQIEHALDLEGRQLALFIDASVGTTAPCSLARVSAAADASHTSHALSPAAVLQVYVQMHGEAPPAFVLGVRGEAFELGEPLSAAAADHSETAFAWLRQLCRQPTLPAWEQAATDGDA
ncbi:MAG: hydrogenase maturation protease [Bacteroidota bacterium]